MRALLAVFLFVLSGFSQEKPAFRSTSSYTLGDSIQPLVIYGEGWSQQFTIINVDYSTLASITPEPTVGLLRFFTREGQPWRIPLKLHGTVDQIVVNLQPGQMMMVETEVSEQPQQLGWAFLELLGTGSRGRYHAFTRYRKQQSDRPDLITSVPFVDEFEDQWIIPMDNSGGQYPGIGLVNSGTTSDTLTLDVHDLNGALRKTIIKTVAARNLHWFSLIGENAELAGVIGQIKVRSRGFRTAVFTLQFTPNAAFTALPVVHTIGLPRP